MTFLKNPQASGQAAIESLIGVTFMIIFLIAAFILAVHGLTSLVMRKWAGQHSLCLVQNPQFICDQKTKNELRSFFALRAITITSRTTRGVIHSEIEGQLIDHTKLKVRYDLAASEYKRVSRK